MPTRLIRNIGQNIGTAAQDALCASALYSWRLRGHTPERMVVRPADLWVGNAETGRAMMVGEVHRGTDFFHGFSWLRDLRAAGGSEARQCARNAVQRWVNLHSGWCREAWHPEITGNRLFFWITHADFFLDGAQTEESEIFQDAVYCTLIRQARHLRRVLPGNLEGISLLRAAKGLLYAGLAFEGYEVWIAHALAIITRQTEIQILSDGHHISRSPNMLQSFLTDLVDIKAALAAAGYPLPDAIQHAIDRAGQALRFFRAGDRYFALFHATQEGDPARIDALLAQAGISGKTINSLPQAGFERVSMGRSLLFFDCGAPPPRPHDLMTHASPLALELSCGKERIFVSCGTHPDSREWQDALRATAAHSAVTIDDRSAFETGRDGHFTRRAEVFDALRKETRDSCYLEAAHNGYVPAFGITHRRRLYMSAQGHDLRGEDILTMPWKPYRPPGIAARFHIHPRVLVSLSQDERSALIRLPTGIGWRFHQTGGALSLEDSVHMGADSRPRKTRQIVIRGKMDGMETTFKWALQREGV